MIKENRMEIQAKLKDTRSVLSAAILVILFLIVLYIRALPLITLGSMDVLNIVAMDDPM